MFPQDMGQVLRGREPPAETWGVGAREPLPRELLQHRQPTSFMSLSRYQSVHSKFTN